MAGSWERTYCSPGLSCCQKSVKQERRLKVHLLTISPASAGEGSLRLQQPMSGSCFRTVKGLCLPLSSGTFEVLPLQNTLLFRSCSTLSQLFPNFVLLANSTTAGARSWVHVIVGVLYTTERCILPELTD